MGVQSSAASSPLAPIVPSVAVSPLTVPVIPTLHTDSGYHHSRLLNYNDRRPLDEASPNHDAPPPVPSVVLPPRPPTLLRQHSFGTASSWGERTNRSEFMSRPNSSTGLFRTDNISNGDDESSYLFFMGGEVVMHRGDARDTVPRPNRNDAVSAVPQTGPSTIRPLEGPQQSSGCSTEDDTLDDSSHPPRSGPDASTVFRRVGGIPDSILAEVGVLADHPSDYSLLAYATDPPRSHEPGEDAPLTPLSGNRSSHCR
jgi:hypothetical protein